MESIFFLCFSWILGLASAFLLYSLWSAVGWRVLRSCALLDAWFLRFAFAAIVGAIALGWLVVAVGAVLGVVLAWVWYQEKQRRLMLDSALVYFRTLQGLLCSGSAFSGALIRLNETQTHAFSALMRQSLSAFDRGRALDLCLERTYHRIPSARVRATLCALLAAYRAGLGVVPILEGMIPALEAEREAQSRIRDLRYSAFSQSLVAFAVPWILAAVMTAHAPGMQVQNRYPPWLIPGALTMEFLGVWFLWRRSAF